jgi:hypothetical protein
MSHAENSTRAQADLQGSGMNSSTPRTIQIFLPDGRTLDEVKRKS